MRKVLLEVFVAGVEEGTRVHLMRGREDNDDLINLASRATDATGQVSFEDMPAGEYVLQADSIRRRSLVLPCGAITLNAGD